MFGSGNRFAERVRLQDGVPGEAGIDIKELRKPGHGELGTALCFCHNLAGEVAKHAGCFGQIEHAAVDGHDAQA